jgi:hypothetical protein
MSDYLANILMRTQSPERCLQPRLRSVFEPLPIPEEMHVVPIFRAATDSSEPGPEPSDISSSQRRSTALHSVQEIPINGSHPSSRESSVPVETLASSDHIFSRRKPSFSLPAEHERVFDSRSVPDASPIPLASPASPEVDRAALDFTSTSTSKRVVEPLLSTEVLQPQKAPIPSRLPLRTNPLDRQRVQRAFSGLLAPSVEARVRPSSRSVPAVSRVAGLKAKADEKVAQGTINVTIGRVEVRASVATARPQPNRASPTVMNLDEYLRRRASGGAR